MESNKVSSKATTHQSNQTGLLDNNQLKEYDLSPRLIGGETQCRKPRTGREKNIALNKKSLSPKQALDKINQLNKLESLTRDISIQEIIDYINGTLSKADRDYIELLSEQSAALCDRIEVTEVHLKNGLSDQQIINEYEKAKHIAQRIASRLNLPS